MATVLYLRSTQNNGIGAAYNDMLAVAGASSITAVVNTTASGTEIQWTKTAGGTELLFVSGRAPAGGFTLTTTNISLWCHESAMAVNAGGAYRLFKRDSLGVETEIGGGLYSDGVEFGTAATEMLWIGNPTDTVFAEDDRILLKIKAVNVGTMGAGTATLTYNAAAAATGDSFLNIAETVTFKLDPGITVAKTIGTTGTFSTLQLWEDGAPADLTTAEKSAATTFAIAAFQQGENITFVGSGATGKLLHTDSTGVGTGTYIIYDIITGNPAAGDAVTGDTSTAECALTRGAPDVVGVIWEGQCQNQEFTAAGILLTVSGSTTSTEAYKHLTTVAGASFRDNANVQTNALRYNASNGCGIRSTGGNTTTAISTENNFRASKLQFSGTGVEATAIEVGGTGGFVDYCIIEGTAATGPASFTSSNTVRNTAIIQRASASTSIVSTSTGSPNFYNCTFAAADDLAVAPLSVLLSGASGTVTAQNCGLFAGDTLSAIKSGTATFNFTTCHSDISGTAGVTQVTYSSQFENVNDATRDFRLKSGAGMINAGTTDAVNAATDIAGTTRPQGASYDTGCWEFKTAAIPIFNPLYKPRQYLLRI